LLAGLKAFGSSAEEYKQDAQDIADGRYTRGVEDCTRDRDNAVLYWVPNPTPSGRLAIPPLSGSSPGSVVIVKPDNGPHIETYFPPDDGKDYWDGECVQ
jgi:hypothetical protein